MMRFLGVVFVVVLVAGCAVDESESDLTIDILRESDETVLLTITPSDMSDWWIEDTWGWHCLTLSNWRAATILEMNVAGTYTPPLKTRVTIDGTSATGGVLSSASPMIWPWPTLLFDSRGSNHYCLSGQLRGLPNGATAVWQQEMGNTSEGHSD